MGLGPLFLQTAQLKDRDDREARIHNDHESQTMVKAREDKREASDQEPLSGCRFEHSRRIRPLG